MIARLHRLRAVGLRDHQAVRHRAGRRRADRRDDRAARAAAGDHAAVRLSTLVAARLARRPPAGAGRRGLRVRARDRADAQARLGRLVRPVPVQPRVGAVGGQQLVVRALLGDPPALEHHDAPGVADRGQAVGDHDRGAARPAAAAARARSAPRCARPRSRWPRRGSARAGRRRRRGRRPRAGAARPTGARRARRPRCRTRRAAAR